MNRPQINEYPEWGQNYISQVEGNVMDILEKQADDFPSFINSLANKGDYAYAPGKWTIKELVGHMIDTERILVYRLLCFVRGEAAGLPGFEEDDYVANAHFKDGNLSSMAEEFSLLRKANLYLIKSLNEDELDRMGTSNGKRMSARAIVYVLAGHVIHHTKIVKERYL
ncbi:DinB family protein [Pedobacter insulae]|uniref:DinB superfamily protein n=1 Tax=Pedobacter insulae TaxID=414048 RepID=A0A1I2XII3_9SPHI|nr:DinB family protein [Pedobacter insulae]SFH13280.1 DinB superfamily protein [Pedobacter insulae]